MCRLVRSSPQQRRSDSDQAGVHQKPPFRLSTRCRLLDPRDGGGVSIALSTLARPSFSKKKKKNSAYLRTIEIMFSFSCCIRDWSVTAALTVTVIQGLSLHKVHKCMGHPEADTENAVLRKEQEDQGLRKLLVMIHVGT